MVLSRIWLNKYQCFKFFRYILRTQTVHDCQHTCQKLLLVIKGCSVSANGDHSMLDICSSKHEKYGEDTKILKGCLKTVDPTMYELIVREKNRQINSLNLIASENFVPRAVLEALGSCLTNKYAEGYPGARYYGGNEVIDKVEALTQERALQVYRLRSEEWGVNVQPYSGSPANFAVYSALVGPYGRIMGLDLPDGGHLSHGFYTQNKKVSATSMFFESMPYKIDPNTGLIDYDRLEESALLYKPKLIIAGVSAYTRNLDYCRFRKIADKVNSILMADMAHISGLVAAELCSNPFEYCDIVTTTTHKTMRGPRGALIFYRKYKLAEGSVELPYGKLINEAVFPGLQGGPHENAIASIAVALHIMLTSQYHRYCKQIIANSKALVNALKALGYNFVTGGTDVHMSVMDLRSTKLDGKRVQRVLDDVCITVNKNMIPGDKSALNPHGIRIGTPALTSRGLVERDIAVVAEFIHRGIKLAESVQAVSPNSTFKSFVETLESSKFRSDLDSLRKEVTEFAAKFEMPGSDDM